jgi:hypothetical protein
VRKKEVESAREEFLSLAMWESFLEKSIAPFRQVLVAAKASPPALVAATYGALLVRKAKKRDAAFLLTNPTGSLLTNRTGSL